MKAWKAILIFCAGLPLVACKEEPQVQKLVRGLKAYEIAEVERTRVRRFPGVLEPSELIALSFELGGTLQALDLDVGQTVAKGDVVARLDEASLELQVENAEAGVAQARAAAENAEDTLVRLQELLERGATTQVTVDDARTSAQSAEAALDQAEKSLASARTDLKKATLKAPFDGVVNSVDATSYQTVSAGTPIASIYAPDSFTVSFSVSFDTVDQLVVGKKARVRLADRPDIELPATVSEIGSRADAVSSFPIVLELDEGHPLLKAGMAVETAIEFPLPKEQGFPAPLSALIRDGRIETLDAENGVSQASVFVFDAKTSTVKRRKVSIGGIRENQIIILDGVEPGDLLAAAGVSFLTDGQEVALLSSED